MRTNKPRILIFIDWFLPGYKAGGPVTSVANIVARFREEYDFYVITTNTDYGSDKPYESVEPDRWLQRDENLYVYYSSGGTQERESESESESGSEKDSRGRKEVKRMTPMGGVKGACAAKVSGGGSYRTAPGKSADDSQSHYGPGETTDDSENQNNPITPGKTSESINPEVQSGASKSTNRTDIGEDSDPTDTNIASGDAGSSESRHRNKFDSTNTIGRQRTPGKSVLQVARETGIKTWYITGVYSLQFAIEPVMAARKNPDIRCIVAPRGMLSSHALGVKKLKKKLFIAAARTFNLYRNVVFQSTNEQEHDDIKKLFPRNEIVLAPNLPKPVTLESPKPPVKESGQLKLVSIGRISPEKNTLMALELLEMFVKELTGRKGKEEGERERESESESVRQGEYESVRGYEGEGVRESERESESEGKKQSESEGKSEGKKQSESESEIHFELYGQIHDKAYWNRCLETINRIHSLNPNNTNNPDYPDYPIINNPNNPITNNHTPHTPISVTYHGTTPNPADPLSRSHFLFLPTKGENYGHAIVESLGNGRPVIISDRTPWRNLAEKGIGFDRSLDTPEKFVETLMKCLKMNQKEYNAMCEKSLTFAREVSENPGATNAHHEMFRQ